VACAAGRLAGRQQRGNLEIRLVFEETRLQVAQPAQPAKKLRRRVLHRNDTICFLSAVLAAAALATAITPESSDQLTTAKEELIELRGRSTDKQPMVQSQLRIIGDLEQKAVAQRKQPAELRAAWAEHAELHRRYEEQKRKVAELERQQPNSK